MRQRHPHPKFPSFRQQARNIAGQIPLAFVEIEPKRSAGGAAFDVEKQKARQQAAQQFGVGIIGGVAAGQIYQNDMSFIQGRTQIDDVSPLADNAPDRRCADKFRQAIDRSDHFIPEAQAGAVGLRQLVKIRKHRARVSIGQFVQHQCTNAVHVAMVEQQFGFREGQIVARRGTPGKGQDPDVLDPSASGKL